MFPSVRGSHVYKSPLDDTTYEAFPVICTPELALMAMRSLTPAFPAHSCFPVTAPCSPVLVFGLPCSQEVITMAVFARQQAEQDMEHGRRARPPYQQ